MPDRTPEDRLREEYFDFLPEIRRVAETLEAEVRYHILPISRDLHRFEQIVVKSRIKECDSAVDSLRRRQQGLIFDPQRRQPYTLLGLKDLAGVRVLAFPGARRTELHEVLREKFAGWERDPFHGDPQESLGYKYSGFLEMVSNKVRGEFQIVSMLVGLFWDVEHSALYKPTPELRGVARSLTMQVQTQEVLRSLAAFEAAFEAEFQRARNELKRKKKKKKKRQLRNQRNLTE
jgi:ppGpp synthetase/RelA/SpoT-type nucleotidyltranferase